MSAVERQWFGDVPEGWVVKRLASYFSERKVKVSDKDFPPLSVTKNGILPQLENVAKTDDGDNRKLVRKGDFVINSRSDRKGSSGVSEYDGSVSLINLVLQPRGGLFGAYCNYLLKSLSFVEENYRNGRGIVADLWTTRYDEMKMIKVAMPPLHEQKAIVAYLDAETGRIDKAIAAEEKMIALLQERREIVINEAVGGGMDFNAETQRRRGWEVKKLFYLFRGFGSGTTPRISSEGGNVPWVNSGDLNYSYLTVVDKFVDENTLKSNSALKLYPKNSIVIAMYGASIGKVAISKIDGFCTNQACQVLFKPKDDVNLRYVFYFLLTCKKKWIESSQGGTQPNINADIIKQTRIPLPPLPEQEAIVERLDRETGKIDRAIEVKRRQIELLRERRQIVIDEAVTGKVKVA